VLIADLRGVVGAGDQRNRGCGPQHGIEALADQERSGAEWSEGVRARIEQIPAKEDATWGAVFALLSHTHRKDWQFHWTGYRRGEPDAYSFIEIEAPGDEEVDAARAEIVAAVNHVNAVVKRDPLDKMVPIDVGLVEVLVD